MPSMLKCRYSRWRLSGCSSMHPHTFVVFFLGTGKNVDHRLPPHCRKCGLPHRSRGSTRGSSSMLRARLAGQSDCGLSRTGNSRLAVAHREIRAVYLGKECDRAKCQICGTNPRGSVRVSRPPVAREEPGTERGTGLKSSLSSRQFVRRSTGTLVMMVVYVCAGDTPMAECRAPHLVVRASGQLREGRRLREDRW